MEFDQKKKRKEHNRVFVLFVKGVVLCVTFNKTTAQLFPFAYAVLSDDDFHNMLSTPLTTLRFGETDPVECGVETIHGMNKK